MNPLLEFFATGVGMVVLIIVVIQAVLWFFVPFMIWGISRRTKFVMDHYLKKDGLRLVGSTILPLKESEKDREKRTREAAERISNRTLYDEGV